MKKKRNKQMVDKRWADKPPLATKASKNIHPLQDLVRIFLRNMEYDIIAKHPTLKLKKKIL